MVTSCPAFAQSAAHVIDAGPEPMIATFLPVRGADGGAGFLEAPPVCSRSRSAQKRSTRPIATALSTSLSILPIVQNFWHCFSWGQTLPQTAGRSEVSLMILSAPAKSPSAAFWRKPGMLIATGQPCMQGLVGQLRHLDASVFAISAV